MSLNEQYNILDANWKVFRFILFNLVSKFPFCRGFETSQHGRRILWNFFLDLQCKSMFEVFDLAVKNSMSTTSRLIEILTFCEWLMKHV